MNAGGRVSVASVASTPILLRADEGVPVRACLIVDWSDDFSREHPTGDVSDEVVARLLRDGWAVMLADPGQQCPLVAGYRAHLDDVSVSITGPGDPPSFQLANLPVYTESSEAEWADVVIAQGLVRIIGGNLGFAASKRPLLEVFQSAILHGRLVVADVRCTHGLRPCPAAPDRHEL